MHRIKGRITPCFVVDYTDRFCVNAYLPTTLSIHRGEKRINSCIISLLIEIICVSPASQPNQIEITTTTVDYQGNPITCSIPTPHMISVRKNEVYSKQPLKPLSLIDGNDRMVHLSGILIKAMEVQQCPTGDYRRNVMIVDETTCNPLLITIFFREIEKASLLEVCFEKRSLIWWLMIDDCRFLGPPFLFQLVRSLVIEIVIQVLLLRVILVWLYTIP